MNILIIGSSSGIGFSVIENLSRDRIKNTIYATCRNKNKLIEKLKRHNIKLPNSNLFELELESTKSIEKFLRDIKEECKNLDGLVLNAGYLSTNSALMQTEEELMKHFNINYFSQMKIIKFTIKKYFLRTKFSSIVAISSSAVKYANAGRLAYSASKSAMETSMKVLSREYGRKGIRFNCIAPGIVNTDLMRATTDVEDIESWKKEVDLRMAGEPKDIADTIIYILSEKSRYMTGQVISIDGGK